MQKIYGKHIEGARRKYLGVKNKMWFGSRKFGDPTGIVIISAGLRSGHVLSVHITFILAIYGKLSELIEFMIDELSKANRDCRSIKIHFTPVREEVVMFEAIGFTLDEGLLLSLSEFRDKEPMVLFRSVN